MVTLGPLREAQDPLWSMEHPLEQKKGPLGSDGPLRVNTGLVRPKEGHLHSIQGHGPQITWGLIRPNRAH